MFNQRGGRTARASLTCRMLEMYAEQRRTQRATGVTFHPLWSPPQARSDSDTSTLTPKLSRSYAADRIWSPKAFPLLTEDCFDKVCWYVTIQSIWTSELTTLSESNTRALFPAVREADERELCWCCDITTIHTHMKTPSLWSWRLPELENKFCGRRGILCVDFLCRFSVLICWARMGCAVDILWLMRGAICGGQDS